jgi:hypothetical protein
MYEEIPYVSAELVDYFKSNYPLKRPTKIDAESPQVAWNIAFQSGVFSLIEKLEDIHKTQETTQGLEQVLGEK